MGMSQDAFSDDNKRCSHHIYPGHPHGGPVHRLFATNLTIPMYGLPTGITFVDHKEASPFVQLLPNKHPANLSLSRRIKDRDSGGFGSDIPADKDEFQTFTESTTTKSCHMRKQHV